MMNHQKYASRLPDWCVIRDAFNGEAAVKIADMEATPDSYKYLPFPAGYDQSDYDLYKHRARFPDTVSQTVLGHVGRIMSRPFNTSGKAFEILDVAIGAQTPEKFLRSILIETLLTSHGALVADYDDKKDEPVLVFYRAEDVVNWDEERGSIYSLTVKEPSKEEDTEYHRRFIFDGVYRVEIVKTSKHSTQEEIIQTFEPKAKFSQEFTTVPAVLLGDCTRPVFRGLADFCLKYYNASALHNRSLWMVSMATPYFRAGEIPSDDPIELKFGSDSLMALPYGVEVDFLEPSGVGLQHTSHELKTISDEISAMGGKSLNQQAKALQTAETARIQQAAEMALLSGFVSEMSADIEQALKFTALFAGVDPENIEFELNKEFLDKTVDPATVSAINTAYMSGLVSKSVARQALRTMGMGEGVSDEEMDEQSSQDGLEYV